MARKRLGIIGFGFIGSYVYQQADKHPDFDIAFVWNRSAGRLQGVPADLILPDLHDFAGRQPDLILEMAHPSISAEYGAAILGVCDYMMLSVTAMADAPLNAQLQSISEQNATSLFIPHGAFVGLDNFCEGSDNWSEVTITFRKHPNSLDFSATKIDPQAITSATVVYDGPVRGAARQFPRNVNTMATCALAGLGFDQTRAIIVADPSLSAMIAEVKAVGKDGSVMETKKVEQAAGVSGTGMLASQWRSIGRAARGGDPGLNFV